MSLPLTGAGKQASQSAPPAPTIGSITALSSTSLSVPWTGGTGATSFNLYWTTDPTFVSGVTTITGISAGGSPYALTGLPSGTEIYVQMTGVNGAVVGPHSATANGTTQSVLITNLVSYYKFQNNLTDSVGSNNGTLVGSPTYGTGLIGQGLACTNSGTGEANSNAMKLPTSMFSGFAPPYAIGGWAKASSTSGFPMIFVVNDASPTNFIFLLLDSTAPYLSYHFPSTNGIVISPGAISVGTYFKWQITHIGTTLALWINGHVVGILSSVTGNISSITANVAGFGIAGGFGSFSGFAGTLDENYIYNGAAPTKAEDLTLYNAGAGDQYPFGALTSPTYILGTFNSAGPAATGYIEFTSIDGTNFQQDVVQITPNNSAGAFRDPDIVYTVGGTSWIVSTNNGVSPDTTFGVYSSTDDCQTWQTGTGPDLSSFGTVDVWSPNQYTSSGTPLVLVTIGASPNRQPYTITTNSARSSWGTPTLLGGFSAVDVIDTSFPKSILATSDAIWVDGSDYYYVWLKNLTSGNIEVWTCATMTGTYVPYITGDFSGHSISGEGPTPLLMSDRWRVYYDKITAGSDVGLFFTDWMLSNAGTYGLWKGGSSAWTVPTAVVALDPTGAAVQVDHGMVRQMS